MQNHYEVIRDGHMQTIALEHLTPKEIATIVAALRDLASEDQLAADALQAWLDGR
jgi:hypothetical protein